MHHQQGHPLVRVGQRTRAFTEFFFKEKANKPKNMIYRESKPINMTRDSYSKRLMPLLLNESYRRL
jgi:hypothetical protein